MTYLMSCPLSRMRERARVRADGLCDGRALMLVPLALTPTLSRKRERGQEKGAQQ
jgi:hypothetical protein